ncbi:hypothetical protein [Streptomyces flaveolus]|uniref:hypothetical protein n=1 Tax=Streptomyces flaveolus TaxID=67297 RepID=UPI0016708E70|nr:hypothetical protein [Streptomyces flaveolus]GGQ80972.1 hypothetical protein GCM10010216_48510 [Streptomyces flaveolus]
MSVKPIPLRKALIPRTDPLIEAVEATRDFLDLPTAREPIAREDGVHVVVAGGGEFARWVYELGGTVNRAPAIDGASLWTLRTETPRRGDGSTVRIYVHVALVADEWVPEQFRAAEQSGPVAS